MTRASRESPVPATVRTGLLLPGKAASGRARSRFRDLLLWRERPDLGELDPDFQRFAFVQRREEGGVSLVVDGKRRRMGRRSRRKKTHGERGERRLGFRIFYLFVGSIYLAH